MNKRGRPPAPYNAEHGTALCSEIATTPESLAKIVARLQEEFKDFPCVRTVYTWLRENESFAREYGRAKSDQMDIMIDELLSIADTDNPGGDNAVAVQRDRLRCEVRKFVASKLKPQIYGDSVKIESKATKEITFTIVHQGGELPDLHRTIELPPQTFPKKISN